MARRHFEACVFVHLAAELRTGDIAVAGAGEYADWNAQLLSWADCADKLPGYLVEVGLVEDLDAARRYDAKAFRDQLFDKLTTTAARADEGYPTNEDLQIDPKTGVPRLKRYRRGPRRISAAKLEQLIKARMPQRSLLGIVARTAYWLAWWRRFGPASGSDPKLADPFGKYVIATFVYGSNMGPYEAARHIRGISPHELFTAGARHASIDKLNEAITDVVNGHARLDLVRAWGDGMVAAADGTHIETWLDNLLAETSIRHGKAGGIAYHHISDLYVALFTHFVPCGVWEAVYIIEGLLRNASEVQPKVVHADTQGQSFPIYTLAHLMGFELMPRVRNWKDLIYYRPTAKTTYTPPRAAVRRAGPQRDRLGVDRGPLQGLDAGGDLDPGGQGLVDDADAPAVVQLPPQPHLPGVPRGRAGHPDRAAATFPLRCAPAKASDGGH